MSSDTSHNYPSFEIKIKSKIHPGADKILSVVNEWIIEKKLCEDKRDDKKYIRENIAKCAVLVDPNGDYEGTVLLAKYMVFFAAVDDVIFKKKEGPFFNSLLNHGNSLECPEDLLDKAIEDTETPVAVVFAEIWNEMKILMDKQWQRRFASSFIWFIKANLWELNNTKNNNVPSLAEYLEYRQYAGGVYVLGNFVELTRKIRIPEFVFTDPTIQRLTSITVSVISLMNDIFSFEKEINDGDFNNLVAVMKHEYNISYQEAIDMAFQLVDQDIKRFFALEPLIPSFGKEIDENINIYLDGCRSAIRGNLDWCLLTRRYARKEN